MEDSYFKSTFSNKLDPTGTIRKCICVKRSRTILKWEMYDFNISVVVFVAAVVPKMIDFCFFGNNQVEMKHPKTQEKKSLQIFAPFEN